MTTWDIYSNSITGEIILIPTGGIPNVGLVYEAVTCNPEYLSLENVIR